MNTFSFFLVDLAIRSSVILAIGFGLVLTMKRASASERHLIMALALAAVACLPIGMLVSPRLMWAISLPHPPQWVEPTIIPSTVSDRLTIPAPHLPTEEKMAMFDILTISNGITAIFFFGIVTQLALLGHSLFWWQSLKRDSRRTHLSDEVLRKAADFAKMELPPVLTSSRLQVPVLLGWWHPVILLPQEASRWSSDHLTMVLCHELAHFRRRDSLWLPLLCILQITYWWHPLVWFAMSRLKQEREQACDDLVLSQLFYAPDYADLIVSTAREVNSLSSSVGALTLAIAGSARSSLEARIRSILNPKLNRRCAGGLTVFIGLVITAILGGLIATSQVQAEPASIPMANLIKLKFQVVEISDKIWNQMVSANDPHFFEKTPCLIKNGLVFLESGQRGWVSNGVVEYYPLYSGDNFKTETPTTIASSSGDNNNKTRIPTTKAYPIFYGLNSDLIWSKADNLLTVDSQVTTNNNSSVYKNMGTPGWKLPDYTVRTVKTRVVLVEGKEISIPVGEVGPDDIISSQWETNGGASSEEMNKPGAKIHLILFITRLPATK